MFSFVRFELIIEVVPWTKVAFWLHFMSRKLRNLLFFNCVNFPAFVTKAYALISRIRVNNKKCLRNALFHHHQHKRRLELTFISNFSYVSQYAKIIFEGEFFLNFHIKISDYLWICDSIYSVLSIKRTGSLNYFKRLI